MSKCRFQSIHLNLLELFIDIFGSMFTILLLGICLAEKDSLISNLPSRYMSEILPIQRKTRIYQ